LSPRSLKLRFLSLVEILLTLGFLTDALSGALLLGFPSFSNPLGSVSALAALTLLSSFLMVLLIALLSHLRGESVRSLALGKGMTLRRDTLLGFGLVPVIFLLSFLIKSLVRHALPGLYSGEQNVLEELMRSPLDLGLFLLVAIVAGGFREELQRAFIIQRFEAGWGPAWLGALLFGLLFGYGHLVQGKDEALIAAVFGLLWGGIYVARRNIVATSISHGLYDALELVRYYFWGPMRFL
jgi:membrane protease YdiL (CAAX protease family)